MEKKGDEIKVNEEILGGLQAALDRNETLKDAMMSFYQAGYDKNEIEEAAKTLLSLKRGIPRKPITEPKQEKPMIINTPLKTDSQPQAPIVRTSGQIIPKKPMPEPEPVKESLTIPDVSGPHSNPSEPFSFKTQGEDFYHSNYPMKSSDEDFPKIVDNKPSPPQTPEPPKPLGKIELKPMQSTQKLPPLLNPPETYNKENNYENSSQIPSTSAATSPVKPFQPINKTTNVSINQKEEKKAAPQKISNYTNTELPPKEEGSGFLIFLIIVLFILLGVLVGVIFFKDQLSNLF